jgi:uncharacterized protein with NAD-binding domain and iron-sulfur cluster
MPVRVAILGGGVAGMSAAHELIERGYQVAVYEKQPVIPGGKARSLPVPASGVGGRKDLPAEHGFRFFPGFYRHLPDTMSRIPYKATKRVSDNLVPAPDSLLARIGTDEIHFPTHFPQNLNDLYLAFRFFFRFGKTFGIPVPEIIFFIGKLLVLMTSCEERRFAEYESLSWWDFIEADNHSANYRQYLADKMSRSLVAVQPRDLSTRTGGYILLQFFYDFSIPGTALDRVLNGPTNDVWIDPWLEYLRSKGVEYHKDATVEAIQCTGTHIKGVTVREQGAQQAVDADFYITAMPVEVITPLITDAMKNADPQLARLAALQYRSMNGILFYLKRDIPIVAGHTNYTDAPWALTSISQPQFWPGVNLAGYGDGTTAGILSVIISDWNTPGLLIQKPACKCTQDEIIQEVWYQLKQHLNDGPVPILNDADLVRVFLAPSIVFPAPDQPKSAEPLLINTICSWGNRPEAITRIENLFLAADYVRTYTDLATMEAANEAARRAVNGILMATGSTADRCDVWPLPEPILFAPERELDRLLFRLGLPHRFPKALLDVVSRIAE